MAPRKDSIGRTLPGIADPTGLRQALWTKGIKFQLNYIEEVIGVVDGGINRRTREGGRLEFAVDADLEKLFGWKGATVHANIYSIHGYGTTPNDIDSIAPIKQRRGDACNALVRSLDRAEILR